MKLSSPHFQNNQSIPSSFTCDGTNSRPELRIEDVPARTVSLALIMDDPDVPHGTFVHWTLWNIPPDTSVIESTKLPKDTREGLTSAGRTGYVGPCPPTGEHRYFFTLYAVDKTFPYLDPGATTKEVLEKALFGHIIEKSELMGRYSRPR